MIRGLYSAASGMDVEQVRQDLIANNLANVSTTGFKKDEAVFRSFPVQMLQRIHDRMDSAGSPQVSGPAGGSAVALGSMGQGATLDGTVTAFTDGSVVRTDRPLDLALQGNALFTVQRGDGSLAYTRAGNFSLDSEKNLVTQNGEKVLSADNQPLVLDGAQVVVNPSGEVMLDGRDAGRLQLTAYDPAQMQKLGDNLYTRTASNDFEGIGDEKLPDVQVQQGFLEQSNVQVVQEMVRMIGVMRSYEANQKTIQMQDSSLNKLINDIGHAS